MKVAVRTNGGPDTGIGHIERCLVLAQQLWKDGNEIFFISKQDEKTIEKIQDEGFEVLELLPDLTLEQDLQQVLDWLKTERARIIITDSYAFDESYLTELARVVKLITIDDLAKFPFPSDIVINQNIYAKKLKYQSTTGKTKFLLGSEFVLLRPAYSNLAKRKINFKVKKILVTLGGTDFFNLMPQILKVLGEINQDFIISITIGTFFNNQQQIIKTLQAKIGKTIRPIRFEGEFHKILLEHDLAITGGGSTTYALAATGTPAISFCLADNQRQNIQDLANYGSLINLGWGNKLNEIELEKSIVNLMDNFHLRQKMAKLGRILVDGRGTKRICSIIQNENWE